MLDGLRALVARLAHAAEGAGLWWGVAISLGLAVASLVVAAGVVLSWPAGHFAATGRSGFWSHRPAPLRVLGLVGKNLVGVVMILLGFVMALPGVPGQGLLTMIIGLTLVDFPGKLGLERRLIGRPFVLTRLNRLRVHFRRAPLVL
ncbi:MAG: uncharacterized protein JWM82_2011 [Myxococcales bacterium]|nr:uncharacterized protein [Myxococcales bacterium]